MHPDKIRLGRYIKKHYPAQFRLTTKHGKLVGEWDNVASHCFVQAVAAEVVGKSLGLDPSSINRLSSVAACHDWRKRLEKCPDDFSDAEKSDADQAAAVTITDTSLMDALVPSFLLLAHHGKASFLQLIQFLLDDMTMHSSFVTLDERVTEVQGRNPVPDIEVEKSLGRPYWAAERDLGHRVERMTFAIFEARGVPIKTPHELVQSVTRVLAAMTSPGSTLK